MICPSKNDGHADVLVAYCARKLDARTMEVLDRHMAVCEECARLRDGQRRVWNALESWEAPPVSADFDQRLFQRIEADKTEPSWFGGGLDWVRNVFRPMIWRPAFPLAAAGVLIIAGFVLDHRPASSTPRGTAQAIGVSLSEAEQVERTLEDMEMLRQFDQNSQEKEGASKSM